MVGGREIALVVERKEVRNVYLSIGPDYRLRLAIPRRARIAPEEILAQRRPWIEDKVRRLSAMSRVLTDEQVLIDGRPVEIRQSRGERPSVRLQGGTMRIRVPPGDSRDRMLLERLARMTRELVGSNLPRMARDVGVGYRSASVRHMKRWGQCTTAGDLRFNSKLVCLPAEVARYVMLHELVHLVHFNHSAEFKALLRRHCPDHRELERRLKTYLK